ncbi:MAG: hypothetical protein GF331_07330 [Chitinivibrionales bacterium]|nr:hypothetical protein [Chitinivibrionales bacterium]
MMLSFWSIFHVLSVLHSGTPCMQRPTASYRTFGPADLVLICLLLVAGAAAFPLLGRTVPERVRVYRDDAIVAVFPIEEERTFTIAGAEGPVEIAITDGAAQVRHSTCRRGICMHAGPIRYPGQQIVCAPNHVIVEIQHAGSGPEQPDAVSR